MSVGGINVLVDETRAIQDAGRAPLLSVRGVKTFYGNIIALKGVDIDVHEGEIVALFVAQKALASAREAKPPTVVRYSVRPSRCTSSTDLDLPAAPVAAIASA